MTDTRRKEDDPRLLDPKMANILYHDMAAEDYDSKWSIQYDERTLAYVEDRLTQVIPEKKVFEKALEVGSGTGFFLLNLYNGGWVEKGTAVDISPGILEVCARNAEELGWSIDTEACDAETLPFEDDTFDLVCGHAFLHHIPKPGLCVQEMARVCKPGGTVLIAGEPTAGGHAIAELAKQTALWGMKIARRSPLGLVMPKPERNKQSAEMSALEAVVDIWEFEPERVRGMLEGAGLEDVRYVSEELLSSVFGWTLRTIEGLMPAGYFGARWAFFGYNNYVRLAKVDAEIMTRFVDPRWFYNITIAAEKPLAT